MFTHRLKGERADYGQQTVATVAQQLTRDFGRGFSYSALTRMVKLYEAIELSRRQLTRADMEQ